MFDLIIDVKVIVAFLKLDEFKENFLNAYNGRKIE